MTGGGDPGEGEGGVWKGKQRPWAHLYNYKWRKYRLQFLKEHPLCVMCEQQSLTEPATVVHHKQPHRGNVEIFWRRSNHEGLCKLHHDSTEQAAEKGSPRPLIGLDGWPVDD